MNRLRIALAAFAAVAILGGVALLTTGTTNAQSSECGPPSNVRFASFWSETDFCNTSIDFSEVLSGGPPPDGIPPIDNPVYETIEEASEWLVDQSPVLSVTVNDETRGYPLAILTWHEIVNTEIGGDPVTVTFCPLCNSAIVFDRDVDGEIL
ncbi:MAG: DUF3179 domain-containing (seleno)protein, partial [Chloroflexota bacterium]